MTDEETIQKLMEMKLVAMAQAFRDLVAQAPGNQMSFAEQAALMIDREWIDRENRRLARLTRAAHLSVADASLENVWCDPARGLDKAVIRDLATGKWIRNKQNVIIVGKTGVGKTFLGAALAQAACRNGMRALCTRATAAAARTRHRPRRRHLRHHAGTARQARRACPRRFPDRPTQGPGASRPRRDPGRPLWQIIHRDDHPSTNEELARKARRPYDGRRHLRPHDPQCTRHRPTRSLYPRKERLADRPRSTHRLTQARRFAPIRTQSSLLPESAQILRNRCPDQAGTSAQILRNTHSRPTARRYEVGFRL